MSAALSRDRILSIIAIAGAVAVVLVAAWVLGRTPGSATSGLPAAGAPPASTPSIVGYTLAPGRSAGDVGADLESLGIVRSARQFRVLVSLMGLEQKLSAGDYVLPTGASTATIVSMLTVKQSVPVSRVTFFEGLRMEEMAELAEGAGFGTAEEFLAAARIAEVPADFAADMPPDHSRQGYLFPDTYIMPVGTSAAELVALMIETLDRRVTPEIRAALRARGLTLHEGLTIASIVEREAVLDDERARIAGVFYNRIAADDMLGADPTVQYAITRDPASVEKFGWWKRELTFEDLDIDSAYNTRKFPGIPPGPIANPGLASIIAVAEPEDTDLYYFVADARAGDGSHLFAVTLEEHERNKVLVQQ